MPDDAVRAIASDAHSAVIALSHDPRIDDLALMEALAVDTFYVGALGSRSNNDKRRARLVTLGLTPVQLARLHGPVGLHIAVVRRQRSPFLSLRNSLRCVMACTLPWLKTLRVRLRALHSPLSPRCAGHSRIVVGRGCGRPVRGE